MEDTVTQPQPSAPRSGSFSSRTIVNALIFLVPVFLIPMAAAPFQFSKTLLALVALAALAAMFLVPSVRKSALTCEWSLLSGAVWLLPLTYLVSSIFSRSPSLSFFGYQLGTDTFGFMLLAAALVSVIVATYKKAHLPGAAMAFLYAAWAVFVFQLVQVLFNAPLPLAALNSPTINTIGRWNDFGVFAGLVAVLVLVAYLSARLKKTGKIALALTFLVALYFMALVNLLEVWVAFGVMSLVLSIMLIGQMRKSGSAPVGKDKLALTVIGLVVAVFFTFFGGSAAGALQNMVQVGSLEVRPSFSGTLEVMQHVYSTRPITGSGPNTFSEDWYLYRPQGVLGSLFWNTSFNGGSGFVPTAFTTGGVFVALAWLLVTVGLLYTFIRGLFTPSDDPKSYLFVALSGIGAVYLLAMHYFYTPSQSLTLMFVLFVAFLLVSLKGTPLVKPMTFRGSNMAKHYALIVVAGLVGIALVVSLYGAGRVYASGMYHSLAVQAGNSGDLEKGAALIDKAIALSPQDRYYRTAALIYSAQMNQILTSTTDPTDESRAAFQAALSKALENANQARAKDPNSYDNLLTRALIFSGVVPLGIDGASDNAKAALEEARSRNPLSPEIDYRLAEISLAQGDNDGARKQLQASLANKPNYTSAILLLAQIDLNEGNLKDAIESVKAAVYFEPQNAVLLYQLGILLLQDKQYDQSAAAFELALQNQPDYANAAFFLAQSYTFLDRTDDAIAIMKELKRTNPDNTVVDTYLSALENGENPFNPQAIASPETDTEAVE